MSNATTAINPLAAGLHLDRRVEPFSMVVLGAHGDLTKRKLLPAIYSLWLDGHLPAQFSIVGVSRTTMSDDEFRNSMKESIKQYAPELKVEDTSWAQFASSLYYLSSNFQKDGSFDQLANLLKDLAERYGTHGRNVFYLSTPPSLYTDIVEQLAASGLGFKQPGKAPWPRIVVEKPFGRDLQSALDLNTKIHEVFEEKQVYRIDHYLGKETVQNIMVLRFANSIFEPLWNRDHIDHVQITNAETLGVEGRGAYYEEAGALRDMVQNHMLQLLSLVAMEPPISLDAEDIRDERAKVVRSIRPIEIDKLNEQVVRGQYGSGWVLGQKVPGYRDEQRVSPDSRIETFVALKLSIDNWRWAGVPFYVRSGKRLCKSITEIAIQFRGAPHGLFDKGFVPGLNLDADTSEKNVLVMQIQPDEGISLKFATKLPGTTTKLRWLNMDFRYGSAFGVRSPSAYERLVLDCLLGDGSLFARTDAVESSWSLLSPVLEAWQSGNAPEFPNYPSGSWGPEASDRLIASTGHAWRRL